MMSSQNCGWNSFSSGINGVDGSGRVPLRSPCTATVVPNTWHVPADAISVRICSGTRRQGPRNRTLHRHTSPFTDNCGLRRSRLSERRRAQTLQRMPTGCRTLSLASLRGVPRSQSGTFRANGTTHGMAPKIYHLHPLVAGDLSDWPAHFARCRAMGFDTVCVAPPFLPGASGDIFATADHETLHPALGWPGAADAGIARITRAGRGAWTAGLARPCHRSGRDRCPDPPPRGAVVRPGRWRRAAQPVADAASPGCRLCPAGPDRGRRGHGRMVAGPARTAGAGGHRRVPLPGPRPRAGVALAADHRRSEAGAMPLPGVDAGCRTRRVAATGRGRLRPRVFLARMVGWARELAGRGGRDVAAHRAGDGIARGFVLRTARGAAGTGQRCCAPTIASRCGWPLPPGAACSCRWASSMPLAVRSTPHWAGRTIFGVPATRRRRSDGGYRGRQRTGRSHRGIPGRWRNAAAHRCAGRCHGTAAVRCAGPAQRVTRRDGAGQSRYRPHRAGRPVGFAAAAAGRRGLGAGGDARGCGCADGPGRGACSRLCADATRDPSGGPRRRASSVAVWPPRGSPSRQFFRRSPMVRLR